MLSQAICLHINESREFKAAKRSDRIWDRAKLKDTTKAYIGQINRGNGFEETIVAPVERGLMIYCGPFTLEHEPTADTLTLFLCDDYMFITI